MLRGQLDGLALRGLEMVVGLEVEFHVLTPDGGLLDGGGQLLLQDDVDPLDDLVQVLRDGLVALDLPLRSIEHEFGPEPARGDVRAAAGAARRRRHGPAAAAR